jgi:hypothetical protein
MFSKFNLKAFLITIFLVAFSYMVYVPWFEPFIHETLGHSFVCTILMHGQTAIREEEGAYVTYCYFDKSYEFLLPLFYMAGILAEFIFALIFFLIPPLSSFGGVGLYSIGVSFFKGSYMYDLKKLGLTFLSFPPFSYFFLIAGALFVGISSVVTYRFWEKVFEQKSI